MSTSTDRDTPPPAAAERDDNAVYDRGDTVCVIGAGASGLAAMKNLREHGFAVDCFERESGIGGAWNWRHDRSPVYASTHLIASRPIAEFPDFPMPDSWPDFPHHSQMLSYLERYAEHFDLRSQIWFGMEVVRVTPVDGDRWEVTSRSTGGSGAQRTHRYAAVVIANGHNWAPRMPEYDGLAEFRGEVIHASAYKDATQLRGRRVLVVGAGNSGCDIAVDAAQHAAKCWHSARRGYWYVPKYLLGRPFDQVHSAIRRLRVPSRVRQWLMEWAVRWTVGDPRRFGLPKPDHRIFETRPVVTSQLPYAIGHGRITPVPDIARFRRHSVELVGGEEIEPDLVIFATGYEPRFEFLDLDLLDPDPSGRPTLFLHAFPRRYPTLAVAGLLEPDSGLLPLVHWQTVAIARWLRLRRVAPERARAFHARIDAEAGRRYHRGASTTATRHWFTVSAIDYLRALERALDELEVTA